MEASAGHYSGYYVIDHYAEAAIYFFVQRADGPGFCDIEYSESDETGDYPGPAIGECPHGDPVAYEFVPDDAAVVVDA